MHWIGEFHENILGHSGVPSGYVKIAIENGH